MAVLTVRRSDKFPVGQVVSAWPGARRLRGDDLLPKGTALATATVAADGSLTFTTLTAGAPVMLSAEVAGVPQIVSVEVPAPEPALGTLKQRIAARRLAVGA